MSAIAIIPARGGSKRIPRKNIADVNGRPMISYPIEAALQSGLFSQVIVSTEDAEIKKIALEWGAEVSDRPAELATDTVFEVEVYRQMIAAMAAPPAYFCAIYPTAIFVTPDDLAGAFARLKDGSDVDAVMSVCRYPIHPFKALQENKGGFLDMVHPKECQMRSQTYPHYVASNGTFYWLRTAAFMRNPTYYQPRLKGYELPAQRAVDIDEPGDLALARALMAAKSNDRADR